MSSTLDPATCEKQTILDSEMEKPELDTRSYRVIRLANQLEALLISDPETDKASAALDVNVGYFNDPEEIPGLAHALEHLLFMGTEKYPKEADYLEYLSSHSATRNGSTSSTSTVYYFEIPTSSDRKDSILDASSPISEIASGDFSPADEMGTESADSLTPFYGALDRFAQFFIAPLFLKDSLDREINAVDSEFKRNFQNDSRRIYHVNKSLFNPKHPMRQFSTGNRR
jgi:insulysin